MGGAFLSAVLVVLVSDSVISHRVRRTGAVPGQAEAVLIPTSHESIEKFDSSPALMYLQYGAPDVPGSRGGPVNPQRPPASHSSATDVERINDYPTRHPEDHPPFQKVAAALPTSEPSSQLTKHPSLIGHTIVSTQFHPTHSFFGCKFFGGCPEDADGSSLPPTGTTKATDSVANRSSTGSNVLIADELRLPTSAGQALADHVTTAEALHSGTVPAQTVTDAVVHENTVSIPARDSPPVSNLLAQAAAEGDLRQRAGTVPQAMITTEVSEGTSKPPSPLDTQRGTGMSSVIAEASETPTTLGGGGSKSTELLSMITSEGAKVVNPTRGSTSPATKLKNATEPPSVTPTATVEVLQRQGIEANASEAVSTGQTSGLTTQPSAPPKTSGTASSNLTTMPPTLLWRRTEITTPSATTSSNGSPTHSQPVFEKTSSILTTAPTVQSSVGVVQILNETTVQAASQATTTAASPRTKAASTPFPTATEGQTEANASHQAVHLVPTESVRLATTASTTLAPDNRTHLSETSERATTSVEDTSTKSVSFQQTRPPSRPIPPPIFTPRPTAPPDNYVRPITQHSTDQFVPRRDRDVEDYYMEDFERRGQCGKCQRRLHYCVQKCFMHHNCEAEANIELSCPRINAPCLPPFKHEVDHCRHSADCAGANHLCCLVGCSRRCVLGVPTSQHWAPRP